MLPANVVVCIPTYRRPIGLRRCLRSLSSLSLDIPFRVIVADNDPSRREGVAVCEAIRDEGLRFPITTVVVEERGIAPNRNALVAEAIRDPDTRFIAMIDDDEWAAPDWLSELMRVQAEHAADIVGGPVMRVFETPVAPHVGRANQPNYAKMVSGPIGLVDATSNILFRAELFRERPGPWFDLQYALMGCEDKDILIGFKIAGRTFAWAHKAVVTEEMPATRCSAKWMVQRAYRVGNTDTLVNLKHRPPGFNFASEAIKIAGASGVAMSELALFFWHPAIRFEGMRLGARVAGKLVALAGGRHQEYKVVHGR